MVEILGVLKWKYFFHHFKISFSKLMSKALECTNSEGTQIPFDGISSGLLQSQEEAIYVNTWPGQSCDPDSPESPVDPTQVGRILLWDWLPRKVAISFSACCWYFI